MLTDFQIVESHLNAILNINETSIDSMTVVNNDSNDNSKNNNL